MAELDIRGSVYAPHLVVLVHGLWGNPSHMNTLAEHLREKHSPSDLRILIASTNTGYTTYDGVEVGGERVAAEIEAELASIKAAGGNVTQFSILGYSLGGLISRYCIGLLYARGLFEPGQLQPVNFTTFASPWLGVRAPYRFFGTKVWNFLGSRTLSTSGQQMFLTDNFRGTGRPLLSIMADPSSVFVKALASFRKRIIYCNITNDRSTPFYTTAISAIDPFVDPSAVSVSYVPGYAPTVIDIKQPVVAQPHKVHWFTRFLNQGYNFLTRLPLLATLGVLFPITGTIFFANAGYQTLRSSGRIRAHESDSTGSFSNYRVPLLLEAAFESVEGSAAPQYLENGEADKVASTANGEKVLIPDSKEAKKQSGIIADTSTLALAPEQFEMIRNLNKLNIRKYPVHITLVTHTHAAILVRWKKEGFREGYAVVNHWVNEEFEAK